MKNLLKSCVLAGFGLAIAATLLAAPKKLPANYTIVTTCGMVTDIVRAVAGDKAKVVGLMGEGVDPHRRPRRLLGPADAVRHDEKVLAGLRPQEPTRVAARSGSGPAAYSGGKR